jgi:hypothetical protein
MRMPFAENYKWENLHWSQSKVTNIWEKSWDEQGHCPTDRQHPYSNVYKKFLIIVRSAGYLMYRNLKRIRTGCHIIIIRNTGTQLERISGTDGFRVRGAGSYT